MILLETLLTAHTQGTRIRNSWRRIVVGFRIILMDGSRVLILGSAISVRSQPDLLEGCIKLLILGLGRVWISWGGNLCVNIVTALLLRHSVLRMLANVLGRPHSEKGLPAISLRLLDRLLYILARIARAVLILESHSMRNGCDGRRVGQSSSSLITRLVESSVISTPGCLRVAPVYVCQAGLTSAICFLVMLLMHVLEVVVQATVRRLLLLKITLCVI